MKKVKHYVLMLILVSFFHNCDFEKLTGHNYKTEKPDNVIKISGRITNIFTGEGVQHIKLKIGRYHTKTDVNGEYQLFYEKGEDEDLNMPVPIEINSSKYDYFYDEIILGEVDIIVDLELTYAAPILQNIYKVGSDLVYIFLEVKDYQGFYNISSVTGYFKLKGSGGVPFEDPYTEVIVFQRDAPFSDVTGLYKATTMPGWYEYDPRDFINTCNFILTDNDGHVDTTANFALHQIGSN